MNKYLKSYREYPAGTLVVGKRYSVWQRFKHWITNKKRVCNSLFVMSKPTTIKISKWSFLRDDFYLFVPRKPYTKQELSKLQTVSKSCESIKDYLTLLNVIRPKTVDIEDKLEQFKTNKNYKMFYLFSEPFQDITR